MAFEVKYNQITTDRFVESMQFLASQRLPTKVAYNIKKLIDQLHKAKKEIGEEYQRDIVEKFAKKKDDGTLSHPLDADGKEILHELDFDTTKKEEMEKDTQEFGERTLLIDREKIVLEDLGNLQMSVIQISALDPVLTTLDNLVNLPIHDQKTG